MHEKKLLKLIIGHKTKYYVFATNVIYIIYVKFIQPSFACNTECEHCFAKTINTL